VGLASIRELNRLVGEIEEASGQRFIRMEMGIPGMTPPEIAVDGEISALKKGVGAIYPPFDGIAYLKYEISRFRKISEHPRAAGPLPAHGGFDAGMLSLHDDGRPTNQGKRRDPVH
jgi:hypothetical protein